MREGRTRWDSNTDTYWRGRRRKYIPTQIKWPCETMKQTPIFFLSFFFFFMHQRHDQEQRIIKKKNYYRCQEKKVSKSRKRNIYPLKLKVREHGRGYSPVCTHPHLLITRKYLGVKGGNNRWMDKVFYRGVYTCVRFTLGLPGGEGRMGIWHYHSRMSFR